MSIVNKSFGIIVLVFYISLFVILTFWNTPIQYLQNLAQVSNFWGPLAYIILAFLSVVVAPLTVAPFIPIASVFFGPFLAAIYSILGWFLGSLVDFQIARHVGRPILKKFVSLEKIKEYEGYVPERMEFWWIVLLRLIIPADLLSYALGFLSRVAFWKYSLATLVSITPFAFIFAYAGKALLLKNFAIFIPLSITAITAFAFFSYLFYRKGGVKDELKEEIEEEQHE
jgi:uncharacterized membrane protein YdjX (TVP38/TMEM64 family)